MKILLLTQVLPFPPDSGPKIKTLNVIKYLARQHEITLVSFVRGDQSTDVQQLLRYCQFVHTVPIKRHPAIDLLALGRSLLNNQPWMMVRDDHAVMRQLVDRLAAEHRFDIVHADQINMAQFAERLPNARKVLDAHNAVWLLYKRLYQTMPQGPKKWLLGRDWALLKRYEGRVCQNFDQVLAVSQEDKAALEEAAGRSLGILVIPIAVDIDELLPVQRRPEADHILHFGTMYWPPNIDSAEWFINEILPLIQINRPGTRFDLVGSRPPQSLIDMGKTKANINVTGYVPDPLPYLENCAAFVVPLRAGGGMRVKILEAMARCLPVVTTSIGCEGIAVEHEQHVLIADTPQDFAQATLRLLTDRPYADKLAHNGRQLIETTYDYRVACQPLDHIYA